MAELSPPRSSAAAETAKSAGRDDRIPSDIRVGEDAEIVATLRRNSETLAPPSQPETSERVGRDSLLPSCGKDYLAPKREYTPRRHLPLYTRSTAGADDRLHMLFNFRLNARMALALARHRMQPIVWALCTSPPLPASAQWATFLRNHDEEDLSQLTATERDEVFAAFAPEETMRLYGRGIRRRLAPMLGGDRRKLELADSLQFTLPGTPVVRYGAEIGMGDDLALPERDAIRTPMQSTDGITAGFSTADPAHLVRPVITDGPYGCDRVSVRRQRTDPDSLLTWFERTLHALRECPEVGENACQVLESGDPAVLAHMFSAPSGAVLFLHNLDDSASVVRIADQLDLSAQPEEILADQEYGVLDPALRELRIDGYGYRWIRLRFNP